MVLPASDGISRVPSYSGSSWADRSVGYRAITCSGHPFQGVHLKRPVPTLSPTTQTCKHVCLASFPFARRYLGNHSCFLFLQLLRCFSSPRLPLRKLWIHFPSLIRLKMGGCPIRKSPDQSLLTAPRSISVFVPSFIGS